MIVHFLSSPTMQNPILRPSNSLFPYVLVKVLYQTVTNPKYNKHIYIADLYNATEQE